GLAMGRPGLLSEMSQKKEKLAYHVDAYTEFGNIFSADLNRKLSYAEKMSKDVNVALGTLNIWIWMLRQSALEKGGEELNGSYAKISAIEEAMAVLKNTNANSRLVLENLLINI
ncbi:MAG: hypothetical protein ACD_15C00143G0001, partial [uncultured bacterium]